MFNRVRVGVCLLLPLISALPAAAQTGTTAIYFDSQPGDYIGQGLEQTWTDADLPFSASVSADRSRVSISATAISVGTWWTLDFAAPAGTPLVPGVYEYATRHPFQETHLNGLSVHGSGRGCNESVGRFRVHEVVIDGSGNVERFAADFEQHCEGGGPALFGAVRYHSTRTSLVPFDGTYPTYALYMDDAINGYVTGPGIDCGAGRTDCDEAFGSPTTIALTAIPNPGYVFLGWAGFDCVGVETVSVTVNRAKFCRPVFNVAAGESGVEAPNYATNAAFLDGPFGSWDVSPVGGRAQFAFVRPYSQLVVESATSSSASFRIAHPAISHAVVRFGAAPGQSLSPGIYPLARASGANTLEPFLQLTYQNSVCTESGGHFTIYEIAFVGSSLSTFSADFEVPCHNGRTFTGSIRYNAARASLLPFDGAYPSSTVFVVPTLGGYVSASGIDCGDGGRTDCDEAFPPQSIVSLQAIASPGYQFFGWGGICTGGNPIITITVRTSGRCLAVFHPIADAPSHPFGDEFLVIQQSGTTPSRTVWMPPDARLQAWTSGSEVRFTATTMFTSTSLTFRIPAGRIVAGDYDALDATGASLQVPGCSSSRGFFRVYQADYNTDGTVASFAADFEAYCSFSTTPYAAGAIRYRASRHVVIPFDGAYPVVRLTVVRSPYGQVTASGIACGPTADDCAETYGGALVQSIQATPSAGYAFVGWTGECSGGSYTQLLVDRTRWCEPVFRAVRAGLPEDPRLAAGSLTSQSQPGEPIGGGITQTYLNDDWSVFTFDSRRRLTITAWDTPWRMEFRAAATGVLAAGSYEGAIGISGSTASPGLSIRAGGSCSSTFTTGRFVIHELRFASPTSSTVEALALDFEQRCNNGPSLRGSIRYRSSRSILQPFADEGHPFTRFDFTGDQSPDLVWQNRNDGRLLLWHLSGASYIFNEPPSIPQITDPNWHIVGTADADLDGYNDLFWQHQTAGTLAIWYMRDTQIVSTRLVAQVVSDTNWQIRTVFDVDRDGQPDLLWQHRVSGHIAVWYMNGGAFRSSQLVGPGQISDPAWTIVGAGDANGDGRADLFWQHPATGQLALWYMDGVQLLSTTLLTPSSVADTNWRVRGIADLNRDGSPDIVWQNVSTSDVAVWMLTGSHFKESRLLKGPTMPAAEWVLTGPR